MIISTTVTAFAATLALTAVARGEQERPPAAEDIAFASQVSDLLLNELVAALFTEFDETSPTNVPHGKQAISLIFNDLNRNMRLIGTFVPLGGENNRPNDRVEVKALRDALEGEATTDVQKVNDTWLYRRSVPLSNTFHKNCVLCHANFTPEFLAATNNPGEWVGALMLAVPIRSGAGGN